MAPDILVGELSQGLQEPGFVGRTAVFAFFHCNSDVSRRGRARA